MLFVLLVILLRGFVLEGYLISTGSMAPGLLGFHKRIVCPTCRNLFAFGVTFDDSVTTDGGRSSGDGGLRSYATCPNCGQVNINTSGIPNAHGDQLLVQKHLYDFRRPRRWEIVVFRSPSSPGEAFVKRVVGLPGDRLRIHNGDLYVNGHIARKSFAVQQQMRIPVSDLFLLADADDWNMSWDPDPWWAQTEHTLITDGSSAGNNARAGSAAADSPPVAWVRYRHWRWFGGDHIVETPLNIRDAGPDWARFQREFQNIPVTLFDRINYDPEREVLWCRGVMPEELQRLLVSRAQNDAFRDAVYRLAARSHLCPVTDHYGYNSMVTSDEYPVADLMLATTLSWQQTPQTVLIELPVVNQSFQVVVDPIAQTVALTSLDDQTELLTGSFEHQPASTDDSGNPRQQLELTVSNIDSQIVVAINGVVCLAPFEIRGELPTEVARHSSQGSETPSLTSTAEAARRTALLVEQQQRWRLGVRGNGVRIDTLRMYRDVYYTPGRRTHAVDEDFVVPENCYFVQGDNSPVSSDSRSWLQAGVPHEMLLGKPFFVHLPSYPATLRLGSYRIPIRIPDISRIRYIH